jgi:ribosomal protein L11 methyltransferase
MSWLQIHIQTDKTHTEEITQYLNELEAQAVTYEDSGNTPIFEPDLGTTPLWQSVKITGLFAGDTDQALLKTQLTKKLDNLQISARFSMEILANQAWERVWMKGFNPLKFGNKLWICPTWKKPPDPKAVNLIMDPGLAFGSGTHPTTAMCLQWLSLESHSYHDKIIIDYGCGSGVLGIAASLLGAKKIFAVDIDPQALMATRNNSLRNHCDNIHVSFPEQLKQPHADLIIANILAGPLETLVNIFWQLSHGETQILLSGILTTQAQALIQAYTGKFALKHINTQGEWALLHGFCTKTRF